MKEPLQGTPSRPSSAQAWSEIPRISHELNDGSTCDKSQARAMGDRTLDVHSQFQLPPHQPSRAEAFSRLFVSHFIESFGNASEQLPVWIDKIPEFLTSPVPAPVKHSIHAAAMAFYGIMTRNVSIQTEATRFYSNALRTQRYLLQHRTLLTSNTRTRTILPSVDMTVCASIMMCHFELMASTTPYGWIHHIHAAARILEIRGPENCRLGLENDMFRATVRIGIVS